jgi:hypothetical protein
VNVDLKQLLDDALGESARVDEVLDRLAVRALVRSFRQDIGGADWRLPIQMWLILMLELRLQNYAHRR